MESSTSYVTIKDGFEITMNKTCTELIIEAEDQGNGSVFSSKFSNDAIKGMGLEFFENVPELFEGLIIAFEGVSEDTSFKLSQDGKLTVIQKVKIGKNEKIFNSPIPLKLVEMDQITKIEKQMRKLFREVEELKKENQQLKEKLNVVDYETISPEFDASSPNFKQYIVSENKKQIRGNPDASGPLISTALLSQEKNSKFQVRIHDKQEHIAIGLATRNTRIEHTRGFLDGGYSIDFKSNAICENGSCKGFPNYPLMTNSTVGVLFIPISKEILFDINGIHVGKAKIHPSHQNLDLYPFVRFYGPASVSIV